MDRDGGPNSAIGPATGGGRGRAVVAAEVFGLLLMLLASAGTCALLIAAHRRVSSGPAMTAVVLAAPAEETSIQPEPVEPAPVAPEPEPEPEPEPLPPPEPQVDPTAEALARLDAERESLAQEAGRKTRVLAGLGRELETKGEAIERSLLEAKEAGRRRAFLVAEAEKLEAEAQLVGLERDVLERRKDEAERQLRERIERPGYAILPYRGPNGTWRRPIPVECRDGMARLEPGGMSFSMVELLTMPGRPGPFGAAVKRLAALLESQGAPGGEGVEAYVLFVVRPDGIRPFYEARSALDANGVPYGYELVDQDWEIEYPAWDDPTIWQSLDDAMQQDPAALANLPGNGTIPGPGGLPGSGGGPLVGDGTFPPRPPGPGEMVDALRSLGDLYPAEGDGPYGDPGGTDLGGRGVDAGPFAGDGGTGGGFGGEDDAFGGRPGVIPILPEGGPAPDFAAGDIPGRPGIGPGGGEVGSGGSGPIPMQPGDVPGAGLGAVGAGGEVAGLGGRGEMPGMPEGALSPGLAAGNGWGSAGVREGTGSGGGGMAGAAGRPGGSGPIGPGTSGSPGAGGTRVGWQDGGPNATAAGGLGQVVGGLVEAIGSGIGGGGGGTGPEADGGGTAAGTPGGQAGGSSPSGNPGGMAASGRDGGTGGAAGGELGGGLGAPVGRFELVVACGRNGVTVHPGSYKIGTEALKEDPSRLAQTLRTVVEAARHREPATARLPSVRFLVEPAGRDAYWIARGQVELAGLGWPIEWQATQPRTFTIFGSERW